MFLSLIINALLIGSKLLNVTIRKNTLNRVFFRIANTHIFATVFHRILDFKSGLDVYPGPFLFWGC